MFLKMNDRFNVWAFAVVAGAIAVSFLAYFHPLAAGAGMGLLVLAVFAALEKANRSARQVEEKMLEMRERVDLAHADLLSHLPLGLAYIDAGGTLLWHNPEFARMLGREGYRYRGKLRSHLPELHFKKQSGFTEILSSRLVIRDRLMKVSIHTGPGEGRRLLSFDDLTDFEHRVAREEGPVIGLCVIDNFAEAVAPLEEEDKSAVLAEIDKVLGEWALGAESFLRKTAEDRYILLMNGSGLRLCQAQNFEILDKIRSIQLDNKIPITLSIGLGAGEENMVDLGRLARTAVDLALGRGGDQVVVKTAERVHFYGGNTEAVEKRTRVRARVVAKSLKSLIHAAENVVIIGHENADLDTAGAALGLSRAITALGKPVSVALDARGGALDRLLPHVRNSAELAPILVTGDEAVALVNERALLIVVDTHKPSMLPEKGILEKVENVVVIDHHRRAEEFIEPHSLVYLEAYASSTCELVAELLQYLGEEVELGRVAASALLAGITVDTKHFVFMTGARTFEAASYLRRSGADPLLVQEILRDPIETVVRKAAILQGAEIHFDSVAIGVQEEASPRAPVISAQAADALLEVEGVKASFVLRPYPQGAAISARSQGEINVHSIMERLGGGGHLTIAAVRMPGVSLEEAKEKLLSAIEEYLAEQTDEPE